MVTTSPSTRIIFVMKQDETGVWHEDPIHEWFELSYAQYLTIPRSALQSMPLVWQKQFTKLLFELDASIDWRPEEGRYFVQLRDGKGRYAKDPLQEYRHASDLPINPQVERLTMPFVHLTAGDDAIYSAAKYPYPQVHKYLVEELLPVQMIQDAYKLEYRVEDIDYSYRMDTCTHADIARFAEAVPNREEWKDWFLMKIPLD